MRLVFVHADSFAFEANAPASEAAADSENGADETDEQAVADSHAPREGRMDDCVVAFVTVERTDAADLDATVADAAAEARAVADHLGVDRLVCYPTAHLSERPADREAARTALRDLQAALADYDVLCAPVDWYTAVEASWKGHPHAVTARRAGPAHSVADDAEAPPADRAVAFPDGEVVAAPEAAASDRVADGLRALLDADGRTSGRRLRDRRPDSLADAGLADAPDCDDPTDLRWYPRGTLVRDLLTDRVADLAVAAGAMPVETPVAGDRRPSTAGDRPTPSGTANAVAAVVGDASLAERDGSRSASDLSIPAGDLPLRLYGRGGGSGTAPRSATTPEIYAVTPNSEATAELRRWVGVCRRLWADLGVDAVPVVRIAPEFADDADAWVSSLVADLGDPASLERLSDGPGDWSVEVSFAVADAVGPPVEVAAVRLDAGHDPALVHCSPVSSVERALAVALEQGSGLGGTGGDAPFPTWLAPTQVRFVPVGRTHVANCDALAADLESAGVRADVDDRDAAVGERIARADRDRVPYLAVVGEREVDGDRSETDGHGEVTLRVTDRDGQTERDLSVEQLRDAVLADVDDYPERKRYFPRRVGERPAFGDR